MNLPGHRPPRHRFFQSGFLVGLPTTLPPQAQHRPVQSDGRATFSGLGRLPDNQQYRPPRPGMTITQLRTTDSDPRNNKVSRTMIVVT